MGLIAAAVGGTLGGNEGDMVVIVTTGCVTLSTMLLSATVPPLVLVILIGEDGRAAIDVVTFATTAAVIIISVTRTAYTCCATALAWSFLPFTGLTSTKQLGGAQLSAAPMPWARFTGLMPATAVSANTRDVVWGLEGGGGDGEGGGGDGGIEGGGEGNSHSFRPEYDQIRWEHGKPAQALFEAWCQGRTGYPLVDAAMLQINQTGYMHNRLRMVVASFLTKDLGLDWRWGERYFALHLNDFDLSANNGGWQWASSSGCDAQPYFRIFNPVSQSRKFDPEGKFILRYLPQLAGLSPVALHAPWEASPLELAAAGVTLGKDYPLPVVAHDEARQKTLQRYGVVKKPGVAT